VAAFETDYYGFNSIVDGSGSWTNESNAKVDNASYAWESFGDNQSRYLECYNWAGANEVPSGATITDLTCRAYGFLYHPVIVTPTEGYLDWLVGFEQGSYLSYGSTLNRTSDSKLWSWDSVNLDFDLSVSNAESVVDGSRGIYVGGKSFSYGSTQYMAITYVKMKVGYTVPDPVGGSGSILIGNVGT